ncbi:MAG: hypothetical protein Q7W45_14455 [Bacteroidota bacterium]|nr:hypothetical protein [Bacteroidota bacterium]MDP3147431.1 hypothetical protein [Bacteroidota bacterium]
MKQTVRSKKNNSEVSIKRVVSDRFFKMVAEAIEKDVVRNQREFAMRIDEDQAEFSKIKNPSENRYVDIEMLWKAVNLLGINANHILVEDGLKTEKLQREETTINGGTINGGQNNVLLTGQAVANNGDVYYKVEKITQGIPAKDRKEILKNIDDIQKRNTQMANEIMDLKKTADRYEREIAKDKKIIEMQEKLIKFMESDKNQKNNTKG